MRSTGHYALKVTSNLFPGANCSLLTSKTRASHAGACSAPGLPAPEGAASRQGNHLHLELALCSPWAMLGAVRCELLIGVRESPSKSDLATSGLGYQGCGSRCPGSTCSLSLVCLC